MMTFGITNLRNVGLASVVAFTGLTHAITGMILYTLQHPPRRQPYMKPEDLDLPAKKVSIPSDDIQLTGWLVPGKPNRLPDGQSYLPTAILLHGFFHPVFTTPVPYM